MPGFFEHFGSLPDPRIDRAKLHKLSDILFITIAAVLSGCDDWNEIELYGQSKEEWLRGYLELPNGIPSHDTFNRIFSLLDPSAMHDMCQKYRTVKLLRFYKSNSCFRSSSDFHN